MFLSLHGTDTDCFRQLLFQPLQLFHFIFFKLTIGVTCYTHDVTSECAIFEIDLDFTVYIHNVSFFLFFFFSFLPNKELPLSSVGEPLHYHGHIFA